MGKQLSKRRDRRKSSMLLKQGIIREPQRGVGHHANSSVKDTSVFQGVVNIPLEKESSSEPLKINLSEFLEAFKKAKKFKEISSEN